MGLSRHPKALGLEPGVEVGPWGTGLSAKLRRRGREPLRDLRDSSQLAT